METDIKSKRFKISRTKTKYMKCNFNNMVRNECIVCIGCQEIHQSAHFHIWFNHQSKGWKLKKMWFIESKQDG